MTRTLALAVLIGTTLVGCGDTPPTTVNPPAEQKAPTPPPKNPRTGLPPANPQ